MIIARLRNLRAKEITIFTLLVVMAAVVSLVFNFNNNTAQASVYGGGTYGSCEYGTGTCNVPSAPQNLTLTPGENSITASWAAPADDGGSAITGYSVQISDDGGVTWSPAQTTTGTSYNFPGLDATVTYTIRVAASNVNSQGAFASASGRPAYITLTLPGSALSLGISPGTPSRFSSASLTSTISTNTGYTVSLSTISTERSLVKGSDTITASAGTKATPATLAADTWGYRVDGLGNFGAGPTTSTSSVTTLTGVWAGVPDVNNPDTVGSGAATAGDNITVWFAAGVTPDKPAGSYAQTVVLTAVGD